MPVNNLQRPSSGSSARRQAGPRAPADRARLRRLHGTDLEVDRNVLELTTLLPDPPEIDRYLCAEVWQSQEVQHGLILDRLQVELGREATAPDTDSVGVQLRMLGLLARLGHDAFYQLSARGLWSQLTGWQRWLVRLMRRALFAPVGATTCGRRRSSAR